MHPRDRSKAIGWGLITVGAIILTMGVFGHHWLLVTGAHEGWTRVFTPPGVAEYSCCIEPPCEECLTNNLFPNNTCECRLMLEEGRPDRVCAECLVGIAQGAGASLRWRSARHLTLSLPSASCSSCPSAGTTGAAADKSPKHPSNKEKPL